MTRSTASRLNLKDKKDLKRTKRCKIRESIKENEG